MSTASGVQYSGRLDGEDIGKHGVGEGEGVGVGVRVGVAVGVPQTTKNLQQRKMESGE